MTNQSKQTSSGYEIVPDVTPETMFGASLLERKLNSFITKSYIGSRDLPSDECISEARHVIELYDYCPARLLEEMILCYFEHRFGATVTESLEPYHNAACAATVVKLLREGV